MTKGAMGQLGSAVVGYVVMAAGLLVIGAVGAPPVLANGCGANVECDDGNPCNGTET
ncbi:MAG: hypothetical protein N3C12_11720 [Candidatus Binatia bacterium]|nr:hypothetical protein [Candidatus Binatia bacterium]